VQEFHEVLVNEHLNRFAGLLAIAQAPGWRMRHPEIASVRGRLDRIARIIRGGESFDVAALSIEWVKLLADITCADPKLSYAPGDLDWFYGLLSDQSQARVAIMLLLAVASSNPRWYTAEQLSQITGLSQIAWRKRAADEPDWMAQKRGKVWFFNELVLRAHGVDLPMSMQIEEASSEE